MVKRIGFTDKLSVVFSNKDGGWHM